MLQLKTKLEAAWKSAVLSLVVALAAALALAFFCAAGFIALADRLGGIDACLIFGGAFVLVGLCAAILRVPVRRRAARARLNLAQTMADAQAVAIGADIARLLGGRRAATTGLLGAFIVGILLSRSVPKK
jgi:hypothetical protein